MTFAADNFVQGGGLIRVRFLFCLFGDCSTQNISRATKQTVDDKNSVGEHKGGVDNDDNNDKSKCEKEE